ncbi:MAG: glycosyltransferase family 4 protein [Daejeonella sp.]|nr:glycosyltransferase family 4 protein [Daejeonella sp.]
MSVILILIILATLFSIEYFYFKIAEFFNIIDHPNQRSSHTTITLRGGGIIFPISVLIYFFYSKFNYPYLVSGVFLISAISFLDDIFTISNRIRLIFQFVSVSSMLYPLGLWHFEIYMLIFIFILIIGIINAYNFMDGINGITGFYSLISILTLMYLDRHLNFIDFDFLIFVCLSLIVFLFFNFRKSAKCFAGDVGSVSIALIIIFALSLLILKTNQLFYILLLAVYGVDSCYTIIIRLLNRENIFKPHRSHVYQILSNEKGYSHLWVSIFYGIAQLAINCLVIFISEWKPATENLIAVIILVIAGLSAGYFAIRKQR